MRIIIIKPFYIGSDYTEDRTEYENVTNCQLQAYNGKNYLLYMDFKEGSKEYNLYKNGSHYVEIEPIKDEVFIDQD